MSGEEMRRGKGETTAIPLFVKNGCMGMVGQVHCHDDTARPPMHNNSIFFLLHQHLHIVMLLL